MVKKKTEKVDKNEQQIIDLTADLQRSRADFENYRKRMELEKANAQKIGETKTILKLLPIIDTVERATLHIPEDIADQPWVVGVGGMVKQLDKILADLGVKKIDANLNTVFDPSLHQAVQFDEESEGDTEVIAEEMQAGYLLNNQPIRHAMVKVTRK